MSYSDALRLVEELIKSKEDEISDHKRKWGNDVDKNLLKRQRNELRVLNEIKQIYLEVL